MFDKQSLSEILVMFEETQSNLGKGDCLGNLDGTGYFLRKRGFSQEGRVQRGEKKKRLTMLMHVEARRWQS